MANCLDFSTTTQPREKLFIKGSSKGGSFKSALFLNPQFTDSIFMLSKTTEPNEERLSSVEITESWGYVASGRTFKRIKFPVEKSMK
jgi:hypothetical protein